MRRRRPATPQYLIEHCPIKPGHFGPGLLAPCFRYFGAEQGNHVRQLEDIHVPILPPVAHLVKQPYQAQTPAASHPRPGLAPFVPAPNPAPRGSEPTPRQCLAKHAEKRLHAATFLREKLACAAAPAIPQSRSLFVATIARGPVTDLTKTCANRR
jgi:hypothetical protein